MKQRFLRPAILLLLAFALLILPGCELLDILLYEDSPILADSSGLQLHFLDVGQADATLILSDGEAMLIDGGNVADSSFIYAYLEKYKIDYLDYIICTHAHEDHVGGLAGALNYAEAGTVFCPVNDYDSKAFQSFVKYVEQQGLDLTKPVVGERFTLGGAQFDILGPVEDYEDANNTSISIKLTYGEHSFLFTGDAEREAETAMLEAGTDVSCTLLHIGHHGSYTSTSYRFLYEANPKYAIISCGEDNSYGHPHEEVTSRLADANVEVFRTDLSGTIVCTSNGKELMFSFEK